MKPKLIGLALITSPMLALYGIAPVFLFNPFPLSRFVIGFVPLAGMIFAFWRFNIYLVGKISYAPRRYAVSFLVTFLQHALILAFIPRLPGRGNVLSFSVYPLVATLAINAIILVMIHAVVLQHKKEMTESENQQLKLSNLEAQKRVLLQQLQPHFLFNALSTLKSLIRANGSEAEEYSVKLSEFLRYSIQAHARELVTLADELQFTRDYLALQQVRFGPAFRCTIHVEEEALPKQLPVFALQALVENALKHNAFTEKKPLSIAIAQEGDRLKVSNTKNPKPLVQESGTGLLNLRERYKLVAHRDVEIVDGEKEFIVYLTLLQPCAS